MTTGQLAAGAFGGDANYFRKVIEQGEKTSVPNPYRELDGSVADQIPTPDTPYPIAPAVAAGLGEALAAGLLDGASWASWPATPQGLPLCRVWGRMEAAMPRRDKG